MLDFLYTFGLNKQTVYNYLLSFVPNLFSALVVVLVAILFYLITSRLIKAALLRTPMQHSLIKISVHSLYRGAVIIITIIIVLGKLGVNVTAALAGVGVVSIAIGFAAQATLANILSGFGIFIDHLYRNGDWVNISGNYGEVVSISLRTTKIRTLDNTFISIPNSIVTSSPVINFSEKGMVRITAHLTIAYKESIDKAREVLVAAAQSIEGVRTDPVPMVVVEELADSGVKLLVRIWVDNPGVEQKYLFLLREVSKEALDKEGISIPFPQRDVHVISEKVSRKAR